MLLEPESMLGVIGGSQSLCQELWVEPRVYAAGAGARVYASLVIIVSAPVHPKNWVLGIFSLGQDFWVRTLGTVGTGDSDLDLGLTESRAKNKKWPDDMGKKSKVK